MVSKISLNDVTIRQAPFPDRFALARKAGFSGIEIWLDEAREYAKNHGGLKAVTTLLEENRLRLDQVLILRDVFSDFHVNNRDAYLKDTEAFFRDTQKMGCKAVAACPTFGKANMSTSPDLFAELCDLADDFGIRLNLEFIGWVETVKDLKSARAIVDKAGRKNGGIVLDTFNYFFGGTPLKDLEDLPLRYLAMVHVVDGRRMDLPIIEISRNHRLFPGKGEIPLSEILSVLHTKGYDGVISLEIFNPSYWESPPGDIAQEGFEAMSRLISDAGFDGI